MAARQVAHLKTPYCGLTETFVYGYITHLRRYRPFVVTCQAMNLDRFPTERVFARPGPSRLDYLIMRVSIPLLGRQLPYERHWRRVLADQQPALIHAHFGLSGIYLLPLRAQLSIPIVTSFYGYDLSSLPRERPFRGMFDRGTVFAGIDQFVVEGTAARRALIDLGCPPDKVEVVHIGADLQTFPFVPRRLGRGERVRLLFCGRFVEKKGLLYALRALGGLRDQGIDFEFRVVGYGPQGDAAHHLVGALGLTDRVVFVGAVGHEQFRDELLRAHVLVAPSVTDLATGETEGGAPTVVIEAQATGMPVVASRHADIPEVVRDGETGFLADERDVDGLMGCLEQVIARAVAWPEIGRAGRVHVEQHYNIVTETEKLEALYDRLIEDSA